MKRGALLLVFSFFIIIVSCKKHLGDKPVPPAHIPARDSWIAGINKEIASALERVYRNDSAYNEVNAAIFSGYYADERVLLKDLLFPEGSELFGSEQFRKFNISAGVFKRMFNSVLQEGKYPLLSQAIASEMSGEIIPKTAVIASNVVAGDAQAKVFSGETAAAIYFPYSTNFLTAHSSATDLRSISEATIVAADREADSGPGRAPFSCVAGGRKSCYTDVIIDDDYTDTVPTHIVENGARPVRIGLGDPVPGIGSQPVTRVYLGSAKLTRQMDMLISFTGNGGGSEIKVARMNGYLKTKDEQVTDFTGDVVTLDYTRSEIRRGKWKRIYSIWDPNWSEENLQQVLAVYEDDTKGSKTFSGSLKTTLNLPGKPSLGKAEGEITYKVEVMTQDDIITQRQLDRDSFFRVGSANQGWGFFTDPNDFLGLNKDWPIYDGGTIWQYTAPWKIS